MTRFLFLIASVLVAISAAAFRVDTLALNTRYLESPEAVTVVVPDGGATEKYPAVYLLHGHGDDNLCYIKRIKGLGEMADRYKMIFITPDGRNSWYWDTDSMSMESFIVKDLVPYIDAHYPTLPGRENRAITGLSMGGHGAFCLAAKHPDIWGNIGAMSGGVNILPFPDSWSLAKLLGKTRDEDPELWKQHTAAYMIPQIKEGNFNIIFDCGSDDFFATVNNELHQALLDAKVPHDYISRPGSHTWQYWNNSLPYHLHYFNTKFPR